MNSLSELEFLSLLPNAAPATWAENVHDHVDIKLTVTIDYKSLKKKDRNGEVDENIHWIELKNVNGKDGWLYGLADYFAFETEDYVIFVPGERLREFVDELGRIKTETKELYKIYTRKGRKDEIMLVKTMDLCYLAEKIVKK